MTRSPSRSSLVLWGIVALAVVAVISIWIFSRSDGDGVSTNNMGEPTQVVVAQFGDLLLYLPLYIAHNEGIFAKHGLDVEIISTGGDDKTYAAVISGSVQFGVADPTFVALAAEQGQQGKVVGLLINGMPNYGVALSSDKPTIDDLSDLAGKTVATVPAPSTSYALVEKLYEMAGLEPQILQVGPPGLVPALQVGDADYALLIEPWVSQVVSQGGKIAFSLNDYYRDFALTGITVSDEFVQEKPEVVQTFLTALTEAVEIFYKDEEAALRAAKTRFSEVDDEILRQGIKRAQEDHIYPTCLKVAEDAWEISLALRKEIGDLQQDPQPMSSYVNNRLAETICALDSL